MLHCCLIIMLTSCIKSQCFRSMLELPATTSGRDAIELGGCGEAPPLHVAGINKNIKQSPADTSILHKTIEELMSLSMMKQRKEVSGSISISKNNGCMCVRSLQQCGTLPNVCRSSGT